MCKFSNIKKYFFNYYLILFFIALTLRIFFHLFSPIDFFPDSISYVKLSNLIFTPTKIEDNLAMPGYPIFLFLSNKILFNYFALDILTSSILVLIVSRLYYKIFKDERGAKICAFLFAIYPYNILYSSLLLTENSFIFFAITGYTFLYYKKIYFAFPFIIISIMIRPTIDIFNIIVIIFFSIFIFGDDFKNIMKKISIFILFYCVFFSPWWFYNYERYGQFVKLTPALGHTLYSGNNEINKTGGGNLHEDFNFNIVKGINDPIKRDKIMKDAAIKFIIENPAKFMELSFKRFLRFFNIIPNYKKDDIYKGGIKNILIYVISAISMIGLYLFSFLALINLDKVKLKRLSPLFVYFIILTGIHLITIASIRYRFPLEFILIILSSFSINLYVDKLSKKFNLNN
tara:strand:- start:1667 stop:2869 length:1203 start_codon:yes stop_codon:yes gene_type:complete